MVDMMMKKYSVFRNRRHWPLSMFFALLNIFRINPYILYFYKPQNALKRVYLSKKLATSF